LQYPKTVLLAEDLKTVSSCIVHNGSCVQGNAISQTDFDLLMAAGKKENATDIIKGCCPNRYKITCT
jgi:hypothetical protein